MPMHPGRVHRASLEAGRQLIEGQVTEGQLVMQASCQL